MTEDTRSPFIVRRWWVNSATREVDERMPELGLAIDRARHLAMESNTRSVQVLDDQSMEWAKFNLLWMVPEEYR